MSKSALTVLREARELISDPDKWTRRTYARDKSGIPVMTRTRGAVCWCANGAVMQVGSDGKSVSQARKALQSAAHQVFGSSMVRVNDDLSHTDVLRMFDAAIASAEAEASR